MTNSYKSHHAVIAGVCALLSLHALDFISTFIGVARGFCEANPLFSHPETCGLMVGAALQGKTLGLVLYAFLPSLCLEAGFRNKYLTSLPLWYAAYKMLTPVTTNFLLILFS